MSNQRRNLVGSISSRNSINQEVSAGESRSKSLADNGIKTATDFTNLMSALIGDVLNGRVSEGTCNAANRVGQSLLKHVELQIKHSKGTKKSIRLLS